MERDLFLPIKTYFENFGYVCDGEVKGIDLYMENGEKNVAVELKQTLDFKSVQQAALRQKITDIVYIGIFKPKDLYSSAFKDKLYLLKRLGIGLIVVTKRGQTVEILSEPIVTELSSFQKRNVSKRKALSEEFHKRKIKNNIGGVNGTKLITGYREDALLVLDALTALSGEGSSRKVREVSGVANATRIMYQNYYGWFCNVSTGYYKVTETGRNALEEFSGVIAALKREI
jgi:hypothetical protein